MYNCKATAMQLPCPLATQANTSNQCRAKAAIPGGCHEARWENNVLADGPEWPHRTPKKLFLPFDMACLHHRMHLVSGEHVRFDDLKSLGSLRSFSAL